MMEKNKQIGLRMNFLITIAVLVFLSAGSVFASDNGTNESSGEAVKFNDWEVVGPSGGDVRVVTIDPRDKDRLYISTLDGQIHTSADGGKTWRLLVNLNEPQLILDQLVVDSRDSKIIYASGHRHKDPGGFFKSTDSGATWKEARELRKESIHSMVQSTLDPKMILVGTTEGVWISKNSGDDWKKMSSESMPQSTIDSLAIDPRTNDTIFAGTWWRPFKSTDSGKSWRLINSGMIDDSDVFAITIDAKNPDHVIASACSGIYESSNNGERWSKVNGIPSQSRRTRDIVQNPAIPGTIYAATTEGFWMTTNGGKSWALTSQRDLEINSIAVHPDAPNRIFIGTNSYGVMVSNDGGKNFTPTNDNFTSRFTYSVTPDFERPNRLYVTTQNIGTGGGFVFISNDGGLNWQQAKNLDTNRLSPFSILQDRTNSNLLYLATNVGLFTSPDRGISWNQVTAPKPPAPKKTVRRTTGRGRTARAKTPPPVVKVEIPPAVAETPGLIPVLEEKVRTLSYTEDGKNGIYAGTEKGLYRTYDIAKGWEKMPLGEGVDDNIFVVYSTAQQPETIWVGTSMSGVLVSRDNGATWQKVGGVKEDAPISSITIDPKRPDYIYIGTSQTLFLSRDGGKSFTRRGGNLPLGNYTSILVNPRNTDEVYTSSALESDGGIFYSDNAGWNWKRIDSKDLKLPSHRIWSMIFDPNDPNRIYAGTHSSGVYRIERTVKANVAEKAAPTDAVSRPRISASGN